MFDFDNLKQGAIAAAAAIVFTATAVGAAVGPARIAETSVPNSQMQVAAVEAQGAVRG